MRRPWAAYLDIGKTDDALKAFEDLCRLKPKNPDALLSRALALGMLNRLEEATHSVKDALDCNPHSPECYTVLANLYKVLGETNQALEAATQAIALDKSYSYAYYIRGLVYYEKEDPIRCLADLDRFLTLSPFAGIRQPEKPYLIRGLALLKLNRPKEAMSSLLMARKLNPLSVDCLSSLAGVYGALGKWHLASHIAQECSRLAPKSVPIHLNNASAYAQIGNVDQAVKSIKCAILYCDLKDGSFLAAIGDVYRELGRYEDALKYYESALSRDADCYGALIGKACILASCPEEKLRDGPKAKQLVLRVHSNQRVPEWKKWQSLVPLAQACAECGEFNEATRLARKALESVESDEVHKEEIFKKLHLFEKRKPFWETPENRK